jgi:hypothetical protein
VLVPFTFVGDEGHTMLVTVAIDQFDDERVFFAPFCFHGVRWVGVVCWLS